MPPPPARSRAIDDSRSETSSTRINLKDRNILNAATGSNVSKPKRTTAAALNGMSKQMVNGTAAATASAETDPSLSRTDWASLPPSILHTYRTAYRLATPTSYTHSHADLIYNSSPTALHAPSAVLARRRLRDLKHQRRKADHANGTKASVTASKLKAKEKNADRDHSSDGVKSAGQPSEDKNNPGPSNDASSPVQDGSESASAPLIPAEYIGKQAPASLATAVRKHFNAQQLNEAETVSRFIYVVRQGPSKAAVPIDGSGGDGNGWTMGSNGREVRKGEGGEVGFRLRFRP